MPKTDINNDSWTGSISNKTFENSVFNELTVRQAKVSNSTFSICHFKNCYLGFDSTYLNCDFIKCKFSGKYSSLGRPAEFRSCKFVDCEFIGEELFEGVDFYSCFLSGKIKNIILKDEHPKVKNSRTTFNKCDLSDLIFDNVSIYGHEVFKNTILPTKGIRLFNNTNDSLIKHANKVCSGINDSSKIESEIIFKVTLKSGQNPIILENLFIDSFFPDQSSKDLFENIVQGYELANDKISS